MVNNGLHRRRDKSWGSIEIIKYHSSFGQKDVSEHDRKEFIMDFKELKKAEGVPAVVGTTLGLTMNIGDYEFARVDVNINVPCDVDEVDKAYATALEWAEKKVESHVTKIRRASKR